MPQVGLEGKGLKHVLAWLCVNVTKDLTTPRVTATRWQDDKPVIFAGPKGWRNFRERFDIGTRSVRSAQPAPAQNPQRFADALAARRGRHSQMVNESPPSVVPAKHAADNLIGCHGHDPNELRIPSRESASVRPMPSQERQRALI